MHFCVLILLAFFFKKNFNWRLITLKYWGVLIFTMLILPIHEHGIFLHLLVSSLISWLQHSRIYKLKLASYLQLFQDTAFTTCQKRQKSPGTWEGLTCSPKLCHLECFPRRHKPRLRDWNLLEVFMPNKPPLFIS